MRAPRARADRAVKEFHEANRGRWIPETANAGGAMTGQVQAWCDVFDEILDGEADLVRQCTLECLNWTPPADDTNSIAALIVHTCGSIRSWLARALGDTIERDRDAEFRASGSADDLLALLIDAKTETRSRLRRLGDTGVDQMVDVVRLSQGRPMRVSRAWCVEHALAHAGEHWGQIQLTRQLFTARA
jgi:hypothetical protein